jgi:hypothetical protein
LNTNPVAELTTGSPVSITTNLATTPDTIFIIQSEATFLDGEGVLDVLLNGISLGLIFSTQSDTTNLLQVAVDDERFGGLTDAELSFLFDAAEANKRLHLDNIVIIATDQPFSPSPREVIMPAPAPIAILVVGAVAILSRTMGRRRRG